MKYDVIGISSITTNLLKVRRMCKLIRKHQPGATVVIGGHVASLSVLQEYVIADHVVRGDGVRWMRNFLSEDAKQPIRHPVVRDNIGSRIMGVSLRKHPGDDLFEIVCELESAFGIKAFFVMDENFLSDKKRALQLLARMEENNKPWSLCVFSSANVLQKYTMEQLVALGVSWVWMRLKVTARCRNRWALHGSPTPQAGKDAKRRLDLRAADFLRDQFSRWPSQCQQVEGIQSAPTNSTVPAQISDELEIHQLESVS